MIDGVVVTPLRQFLDSRGKVMHMLRSTDPHFERFGEIYFSTVFPGVVKGWHLHTTKTINFAVPHGLIRLVLFDDRPNSNTRGEVQELFIGPENYSLVTIPPEIWYGFQGVGTDTSIVANCATHPHDPQEGRRKDPFSDEIPFTW